MDRFAFRWAVGRYLFPTVRIACPLRGTHRPSCPLLGASFLPRAGDFCALGVAPSDPIPRPRYLAFVNASARSAGDSQTEEAVETHPVTMVDPPTRVEAIAAATARWRAALADEAGGSARSDIDLLAGVALDLSAAHPSGMAQLFAGRPTRLSNLVREPAALSTARRRARAVVARAQMTTQQYGVGPTSLAIGVASWTETDEPPAPADDVAALAHATGQTSVIGPDFRQTPGLTDVTDLSHLLAPGHTVRVPVLLRPVLIHPRGSADSDYELTLEPTVEVNPVLARALRRRGALLDPGALGASTFADGGFNPRSALERINSLGEAVLQNFVLSDSRVVGAFVHPGQVLVDDLDSLGAVLQNHEVIAALAGDDMARAMLAVPIPEPVRGDRDLAAERGAGDLDDAQRHILDVVASGAHTFVDAPPGADVAGTVAAMVADAAAAGRTVLYVPSNSRGSSGLREALQRWGLEELLLEVPVEAGWRLTVARRLLASMTLRPPEVNETALAEQYDVVSELREYLAGYVAALHLPREPWGVSAYDALQALASLTAARPAPRTLVRLDPHLISTVDQARMAELGEQLTRAAVLGAFTIRPTDTAWYNARLYNDAEAQTAVLRVDRLLQALPQLRESATQMAEQTQMTVAETVSMLGEQIRVLDLVRQSLDVFLPEVFEHDPMDLVAATASKQWRAEHDVPMAFGARHRLRRQAKDLIRPGRPVTDLHEALLDVQARRRMWQSHCDLDGWPQLPDSLETIEVQYAAVERDLAELADVLGDPELALGTFEEITVHLRKLQTDRGSLQGLPERARVLSDLLAAGLGGLIDDLSERHVSPLQAPSELELAWWTTVFESILSLDPLLAGYDGAALEALAEQFASADRAVVAARSAPLLRQVVTGTQNRLRAHRDQGEALFVELVEESLGTLRDTIERYPDVTRHLRPVLAVSPMVVPVAVPPTRQVDLVIIDAAGQLPTQVAVPSLARGRQVVVIGDARRASGAAVSDLAEVLPQVSLRTDTSGRDPYLTAFLAEHGYGGILRPMPLPHSQTLVHHTLVDGTGMPDSVSGVVESTREEAEAVARLVVDHAVLRPDETLAVIAGTARHAEVVRDAVMSQVRGNPGLSLFFDASRVEPFVVLDLVTAAGLSRDAVILSLGLGRTPHRRVLHTFGVISAPEGASLLLDALGATRKRLTVVSSFGAEDLDSARLRPGGPQLMRDLLDFAAQRSTGAAVVEQSAVGDHLGGPTSGADSLLLDVAERLWRHGLDVELGHGLPGGIKIPLAVGHPGMPGRFLVAVLTDDERYVAEPSVRMRDRLVVDRLRKLGWSVVRVWSVAAFLDPEAEVDRVRRAVHLVLPPEVAMPPTRVVPVMSMEETGPVAVSGWYHSPAGTRPVPAVKADVQNQRGKSPQEGNTSSNDDSRTDTTTTSAVITSTAANATQDLLHTAQGAATTIQGAATAAQGAASIGQTAADAAQTTAINPPVVRNVHSPVPEQGVEELSVSYPDADTALVHGEPRQNVGPRQSPEQRQNAESRQSVEQLTGNGYLTRPSLPASHFASEDQMLCLAPSHNEDLDLEPAFEVEFSSDNDFFGMQGSVRPDVPQGLQANAYSDDQLDALATWICADGAERTHQELAALLRFELGVERRSKRFDTRVKAAVRRALT